MTDRIHLDYETRSRINIKKQGPLYTRDASTEILMAAWSINDQKVAQWDAVKDPKMPGELRDILEDPKLHVHAFNAAFERGITNHAAKIATPYTKWRCTMAHAYMMSFGGPLKSVGQQVGLSDDKMKYDGGKKLIDLFCGPNKVTKLRPQEWNTHLTHPEEWEDFLYYNRQDVEAERAIANRLCRYDMPKSEWLLYAIDQSINDAGIPVNTDFAVNALSMAKEFRDELMDEFKDLTQLSNPNSATQFLPWLKDRGYPFDDLRKDTVQVVLTRPDLQMDEQAVRALKLRQVTAKSSISKFDKILDLVDPVEKVVRGQLQFAGGQRTSRWSGRGMQPQNLPRTYKGCEEDPMLTWTTEDIMARDKEMLKLTFPHPMNVLSGMVRSAIQTPEGEEFRVADLSSIESVVQGWVTGCKWINEVLGSGRDIYKSFAIHLYNKPYEEITRNERNNAKPATLGGGYGMGGGDLMPDGKRGGLWGYAENMGIELSRDESHESVRVFRKICHEIVTYWKALDDAMKKCINTGKPQRAGLIMFENINTFIVVTLPSGRRMFYKDCKILKKRMERVRKEVRMIDGVKKTVEIDDSWTATNITYMGWSQTGNRWERQYTRGAKLFENFIQAIARDILKEGMIRSFRDGFNIRWSVHDELITSAPVGDDYHTLDRLITHMTDDIDWAPGLKLKAAGWCGWFYRKD